MTFVPLRHPFKVNISLKDTQSQIGKKIEEAMRRALFQAALRAREPMQERLKEIIRSAIIGSRTYQSIINGRLKFELGIPNGRQKLQTILEEWINSIKVEWRPGGPNSRMLLRTTGIQSDYSNVLGLPEAHQEHENPIPPVPLPWLEWLLLRGSDIVIRDYHIVIGSIHGRPVRGRAGPAIMIKRGAWSVPAEFQGVKEENFITKAIDGRENQIVITIEKELAKRLR